MPHFIIIFLHHNLLRSSGTRSFPWPLRRKSLKLVSARTSMWRWESWFSVPMCGRSTFCGNSSKRGFTRGSFGYTSRPTDESYSGRKFRRGKGNEKNNLTHMTICKSANHRLLVNNLSTCGVHDDATLLHRPNFILTHQMNRLVT